MSYQATLCYNYTMNLFKKKDSRKTEQEKVEERREEVLATGRKFKYPLQWTKHRIVVNTTLIGIVVLAVLVAGVWFALYRLNMTDDLLFRLTKIFPAPVAYVDSNEVRFSDYLMLYRSSMTSLERQSTTQFEEGSIEEVRNEYKRAALTNAELYSFATKIAKEKDITVSDDEIQAELQRHVKIGGIDRREESFLKIVSENFGLSRDEYERMIYLSLIKSKVATSIDVKANQLAEQVESILDSHDYEYMAAVEELGNNIIYEETGGLVGSTNIDGGRATEAMKLEPGQSSKRFISMNGDGYYFVKLIKKTDTEAQFVSIKIPFTELDVQFAKLQEEGKINELIEIKELGAIEQPSD